MKFKQLIQKLLEQGVSGEDEVFVELWQDVGDDYKSVKLPIKAVDHSYDSGIHLTGPKPHGSIDDIVLICNVKNAFTHKWETHSKEMCGPNGYEMFTHQFPMKKKIKLNLPDKLLK